MRMMLALIVLGISAAVVAEDDKDSQKFFEEYKADTIKVIEDRISTMNKTKICVQAAKSVPAIKYCRQITNAMHDKIVAEMRAKYPEKITGKK